jgi:predicted nucleotidyltransferase
MDALQELCRRHHIRRLLAFGSVLRGDFGAESDIDLLYEFEPGHNPGWGIVRVREELEQVFGRKVDLVPLRYLDQHLRDRILDDARVIHVAA